MSDHEAPFADPLCAACPNVLEFKGGTCPVCRTVWFRQGDGTMAVLGNADEMEAERRRVQALTDDEYVAERCPDLEAEVARLTPKKPPYPALSRLVEASKARDGLPDLPPADREGYSAWHRTVGSFRNAIEAAEAALREDDSDE